MLADWTAASELSFLTISNTRLKVVALSRPHIFHALVFPWPMTVSEHKGPFCTKASKMNFKDTKHFKRRDRFQLFLRQYLFKRRTGPNNSLNFDILWTIDLKYTTTTTFKRWRRKVIKGNRHTLLNNRTLAKENMETMINLE